MGHALAWRRGDDARADLGVKTGDRIEVTGVVQRCDNFTFSKRDGYRLGGCGLVAGLVSNLETRCIASSLTNCNSSLSMLSATFLP